jgi:site-specific DNA-methyltransferase (adenine-specific)
MRKILLGDSFDVLPTLPKGFARLVYIDPPFNTRKMQKRERIRVRKSASLEDRKGFGDKNFEVEHVPSGEYCDDFDDYEGFLLPRIERSIRCMTPDASLFVHLDFREVHGIKIALDRLLGRASFMNEIIWAYDYGGRPKNRWPAKHDTILWYARDPKNYVFNYDAIDRIPYMAPGLVGPEKAARGKTPTDVWWHTIVATHSKEKTGYPTQKPLGILRRIIAVHSNPGDIVLDYFCGSGSTGEAAAMSGRDYVLVDSNAQAVAIARERLRRYQKTRSSPKD